MLYAWVSLLCSVAFADFYVWMVASGRITDIRLIYKTMDKYERQEYDVLVVGRGGAGACGPRSRPLRLGAKTARYV